MTKQKGHYDEKSCNFWSRRAYRQVPDPQNAANRGYELSVFVRNPAKFGDMDMTGVNILTGDALNA